MLLETLSLRLRAPAAVASPAAPLEAVAIINMPSADEASERCDPKLPRRDAAPSTDIMLAKLASLRML
jgi:hypothetical protein